MSKLYDVTVIGDGELSGWLAAFAFAGADLRVALILRRAPDPGLPAFPDLPADPSRSAGLMGPLNLAPLRAPRPAYLPDLQIIVEGRPLDVVADPAQRDRAVERDFQQMAPQFHRRALELTDLAATVTAAALDNDFPALGGWNLQGLLPWKLLRNRSWQAQGRETFAEWAHDAPSLLKDYFLAAASTGLGVPLTSEAPVVQVALGYSWVTSLHAGPGPEADLREQAAALTARRGAVLEAEPEALIGNGRTLNSLRLKGGQIIDTRLLIAPAKRVYTLLGLDLEGKGDRAHLRRITHHTYPFKLERSTLPESLAMRAVVMDRAEGGTGADNLLVLSRAPRVPKRDTVAVTVMDPPPDFDPLSLPHRLARSLAWLDPDRMIPDDTREPLVNRVPAPGQDFHRPVPSALPFDNALPAPAEVLPGWGPAGSVLAVLAMRRRFLEAHKKGRPPLR